MGRATAIRKGVKALKDAMRKRRGPGRSIGPAGASTVSKDGKRMKTTKKPTAKQKQLEKLKDMRNRVMGTQKVMTAAMGGQAQFSKKKAENEQARRRFAERLKKGPGKPKVGKPIRKGLAGLMAGAAKGVGKTAKGAGKAAGKGLKGALAKLAGGARRPSGAKLGAAARAFQKAKARKPSGRLTADDLRRATRSR
tara:strand:- start:466 stop:1050 length:585 start_codon:yes stop_codon:yes gene_type:complete